MTQFNDVRCGVYLPKRSDDICADLLLMVGQPCKFVELFEVESGSYAGEVAYGLCDMHGNRVSVGWVPGCDIAWLEPSHESET